MELVKGDGFSSDGPSAEAAPSSDAQLPWAPLLDAARGCAGVAYECITGNPTAPVDEQMISFRSQGEELRGYLVKPTRFVPYKLPVVIFAHGFSCTQHMGLLATARALCMRVGCAALTFDHAGFGQSDGRHRAICNWTMACGYLDAVTYLQQAHADNVDMDRVCVWGESMASRLAMVAASVLGDSILACICITPPCGRVAVGVDGQRPPVSNRPGGAAVAAAAAAAAASGDAVGAVPATNGAASSALEADRRIWEQMRKQLLSMRAQTTIMSDTSQGESGGSLIPDVVSVEPVLVIPAEKMTNKEAHVDLFDLNATILALSSSTPPGPPNGGASAAAMSSRAFSGRAGFSSAGRRPTLTDTRGHVWLGEDRRCKHDKLIIAFFNEYSRLEKASWTNDVVYVERAISTPWDELAALPFIEAALCFIVASDDEMENCSIDSQEVAFKRAAAAKEPRRFATVPTELGGHAGMMDPENLIGRQADWLKMIDEMEAFLREVFDRSL